MTSLPACCDWGRNFEFSIYAYVHRPSVSKLKNSSSFETERETALLLSIGDAFPMVLIARTRHEPYIWEGVLVLDLARWLLGEQGF